MKFKGSTIFWTFIWCLFMGVITISIGLGAVFPAMNRIAKPFVCPTGIMDLDKQVYRPYPGNTITTITWYCMDEKSGVKEELGIFPMSLYSGTIYGLLLFVVVYVIMLINANRLPAMGNIHASSRTFPRTFADSPDKVQASEKILIRMRELKDLRAADLISESEYEEKRKEILKNL